MVNWNTGGSKPLHIMFKTGHALPLVGTRILRPRTRRGESAQCPREITAAWPATRHVRDLDLAVNRPQLQSMHGCGQFMSSLHSRQQLRPQMLHIHAVKLPRPIHKLAAVTKMNGSSSVYGLTVFGEQNCPRPRNIRMPASDNQSCHRRIVAATLTPVRFPVRIRTISPL